MELVRIENGRPTTTSIQIAAHFGKQHKDVIRKIENLSCPADFNERNFTPVTYIDSKGEYRPMFQITRDGFVFLAMGFTGAKAAEFKIDFLNAFNAYESAAIQPTVHAPTFLSSLQSLQAQNQNLQQQSVEVMAGLQYLLEAQQATDQKATQALERVEQIEAQRTAIADDLHGLEQPSTSVPARTTRANLIQVVNDLARLSGLNHQAVWRELYTDYKLRTHIDLRTRAKNFKSDSILDFAEKHGHVEGLYAIAFERLQKYASTAIARRGN